jgi:hypothetical protein
MWNYSIVGISYKTKGERIMKSNTGKHLAGFFTQAIWGAIPVIAAVGQAMAFGTGGPWIIREDQWRGEDDGTFRPSVRDDIPAKASTPCEVVPKGSRPSVARRGEKCHARCAA